MSAEQAFDHGVQFLNASDTGLRLEEVAVGSSGVRLWCDVSTGLRPEGLRPEGLKEDLQSSSAELVYGQTLRVPGDFIPDASVPWSLTRQRSSLLEAAKVFAPVRMSWHSARA
ncbi:unnamed protein product [Merluccius merluccius]